MSRQTFWKLIDDRVKLRGPFPPLKLFKLKLQSFYSKTKAGVDGATQQRAILRSSTSHFQWEQNLVSQILKTISIYSFVGWRMSERVDLLESTESLKALYKFRNPLSKVQATADFIFDVSQELLSHADTLQENSDTVEPHREITRGSPTVRALITKAKARRRNRLTFYNSTDGRKLRLNVKNHTPVQKTGVNRCSLCGQNWTGYRRHQTSYVCSICPVRLCVRTYAGLRKSCFSVCDSSKVVEP